MPRVDYEPPKVCKLKYIIASATNFPDLHDKVNKLLSEGWTLQGGVAEYGKYICQAMVREEEI